MIIRLSIAFRYSSFAEDDAQRDGRPVGLYVQLWL